MASSSPRRSDMTDVQRRLARNIDLATDTLIAYAAPEVPELGNTTAQSMLEDLGRMNIVRKACEKVEKILKERIKPMLDGKTELRSDNFNLKYENRPRTALNQTKAKAYFEEHGILDQFMESTEVPTMTIKENA